MTINGKVGRDRNCLAVLVILVRDRPRVEVSEPDHELVHVGTASGVGGEQIICNISYHFLSVLRPFPSRLRHRPQRKEATEDRRQETHRHGGDLTELLVDPTVELNVGEALDVVSALP